MDHECSKCVSVGRKENIPVSEENLKKTSNKPIFLGYFSLSGWPGHSPFFIFRCSACNELAADSPHGYLYLAHYNCPSAIEINGMRVSRWQFGERDIKELEESINRGKYIP